MNDRTDRQAARSTGQCTAGRRWRAAAAAVAAAAGAMMVAGCGRQVFGIQQRPAAASIAKSAALSANSSCAQATLVVERALGDLRRLRQGTLTAADARRLLGSGQADVGRLGLAATDDPVLQENLVAAFDAFTAFRAVILDPKQPAYPDTFATLAGTLTGFGRTCSVANPDFASGTRGWAAASRNTVLSRSTTAYHGHWSLRITNEGKNPAAAGFTDSPSWVALTLRGSEQIGLWARAVSGATDITVEVRELSGATLVGRRVVTMRLGPAFRFGYLTYRIRRPGRSRLSVTVSAASLGPGQAFLVDDVTIVRD